MIDLRQIECFCAVARSRSFSRAAIMMSMDASGLSRHVRKLEEGLRSKLLYRNGRGVELTESGTIFYEAVSSAITMLHNAYEEVAAGNERPKGRVTLGLPASVSGLVAIPLLRMLHEHCPDIHLHLMDGSAANVEEWLASGRVDIAVLSDQCQSNTSSMQALIVEDLFVIGTKAPPCAVETPAGYEIAFADLAQLALMMPAAEHKALTRLNRSGYERNETLRVLSEIDSLMVLKEILKVEEAFAVLPIGCVFNEVAIGNFTACRIVGPVVTNTLFMGCANNRPFSSAMRHVCASLCAIVAKTADPKVGWSFVERRC